MLKYVEGIIVPYYSKYKGMKSWCHIFSLFSNPHLFVCMYGWMDGCMDVWMYGCMDVWMYLFMYVCM